ncbi:MAG: GHKL domain-containing protein [Eubacterium sp.]|nr:GHKL domain-containing protein [Eubacterium sp.]
MSGLTLRYALELAFLIPAAIVALLPVLDHLRYRLRTIILAAGAIILCIILAGSLICAGLNISSDYFFYPGSALCLIIYMLVVDLGFFKKFFCFCNAALLMKLCYNYTLVIMAPYEQVEDGPLLITSSLVCMALCSIIGAVFFRTLIVKLPTLLEEKSLDQVWGYLCVIILGLTLLMYWMSPEDLMPALASRRLRYISLVLILAIPIQIYIIYHALWVTVKQNEERAQLQQENNLLQLEQKRYIQFLNYMNETRTLRHDFRQHLRVLDKLSREGQVKELQQYIRGLTEFTGENPERYCANPAADAIISYYAALSESKGIHISWTLELPENLPIQEQDYCSLIGNLLENAIHATEALPPEKRQIIVVSRMLSPEMLGLTVENPYEGSIRLNKQGLPRSRRKNGGIGLSSVNATVQKYHGTLDINTKKGKFRVGILLYHS